MIAGYKYSPKYWVGHSKVEQDVFLETATKGRATTVALMEERFGEDWFIDENLEVILVEVLKVER